MAKSKKTKKAHKHKKTGSAIETKSSHSDKKSKAKKKKRADREEENFDSIVDTYRSTFVDEKSSSAPTPSPREGVKKKRWFE